MVDTTLETLKKVSGSKLATYCSSALKYANGSLKIDRDPEIFEHMLIYLQSDRKYLPK